MVELQDEGVTFAAVDARVGLEVRKNPDRVLVPTSVHPQCRPGDVIGFVGLVMGPLIDPITRLAFRLASVPVLRELGQWEVLTAGIAPLEIHD
jgi:hypothetical protein